MIGVKDKGILLRIVEHCKRIEGKSNNLSKEEFDNLIDVKEIIAFNLLQIGELVKRLSEELITNYTDVSWSSIARMRDRIVHRYDSIDYNRIWLVVTEDVKALEDYCLKILSK